MAKMTVKYVIPRFFGEVVVDPEDFNFPPGVKPTNELLHDCVAAEILRSKLALAEITISPALPNAHVTLRP